MHVTHSICGQWNPFLSPEETWTGTHMPMMQLWAFATHPFTKNPAIVAMKECLKKDHLSPSAALPLVQIHPNLSLDNNIEIKLFTIKATFCWFWGCLWMRRTVTMKDATNTASRPVLQGSKLAMKWIPYVVRTLKQQTRKAVWKTKWWRGHLISALKRKWLLRRMIAGLQY